MHADHVAADGRHLVLSHGAVLRRIWLRCNEADRPLAALIPCDALAGLRGHAALDFCEGRGDGTLHDGEPVMPTPFQTWRLNLLLAILDAGGGSDQAPSHEIARQIVYPGLAVGRGVAWKTAPERRRTQRLIKEAHALMTGGYRALLAGGAGRQK